MKTPDETQLRKSLNRHTAVGLAAIILLVGGAVGWAATTELSGAVIAPGLLVVDGHAKKVQHLTGGIVAKLLVREGQQVRAGEVLIQLDATVVQANLSLISNGLNQLYARRDRLLAERGGFSDVPVSRDLLARLSSTDAEASMLNERRLFADRRQSREGQQNQLYEQIKQLKEQINGLLAQQLAKDSEIGLIGKELEGTRKLFDAGLTAMNRVNSLDRSAARLLGERGELVASIAAARGKIAEIGFQLLQVDQTLRAEVSTELRDVENKLAELSEQEIAARDQLEQLDIKSTITGTIHQLAVHTIGGVVTPAEVLMDIVPNERDLTVDVRIQPQDIDQLAVGQTAILRMSAFNRSTTPELQGTLVRLSADLEADAQSGGGFYRGSITIRQPEILRLPNPVLVPGMPVECFIRTSERTVISYLMKPLKDHASRVFREE